MATQRGGKKPTSKARSSGSDFYIPPVPVAVVTVRKPLGEEVMGWIAACVLVALVVANHGHFFILTSWRLRMRLNLS
jgi:hypothetical protein